MALNYLQRVAGAAVRTAAQAKPVATGPPRMPDVVAPPVQPFASTERPVSETDSTWDTLDSPIAVPPVPQTFDRAEPNETKAAPLATPTPTPDRPAAESKASRFESLLRPPAEVIRTPPGLRSLARSIAQGKVQPAPPTPPETKPEVVQESPSSDVRPAAAPMPAVVTAAAPLKPTPAAPAPVPSAPAVVPKPQPVAALPNARASKAESRIHIGRVEVQVNNARPASPAPKTAPAVSPASDSLAARYLGRFILRP